MKKICVVSLALIFAFPIIHPGRTSAGELPQGAAETAPENNNNYAQYIEKYNDYSVGEREIVMKGNECLPRVPAENGEETAVPEEASDSAYIQEGESVSWKVTVPSDSLYAVNIRYLTVKGNGHKIEFGLKIDDLYPFEESRSLKLSRIYADGISNNSFEQDIYGNDFRPEIKEQFSFQEIMLCDPMGYINEPFLFALARGEHIITWEAQREPVIIDTITLTNINTPQSYEEYIEKHSSVPVYSGEDVNIRAEMPSLRSNVINYAVNDSSSPKTEPQDAFKLLLNTIGAERWQANGEWLEWEIDVPEEGMYHIIPRYKQSFRSGLFSSRKIIINGEVPFKEAEAVMFEYDSNWKLHPLKNQNHDFLFYLKKGNNTIRMEAVLGEMAPIIVAILSTLSDLNDDYLKIISITGSQADLKRDYNFEKLIPETIENLKKQKDVLYDAAEKLQAVSNSGGQRIQLLKKVAYQVGKMGEEPRSIASGLDSFKSNLGALGTWISSAINQPLQLDYISFSGQIRRKTNDDGGFFSRMWFELAKFIASFTADYNQLSTKKEVANEETPDKITVWALMGRDNAQIIQAMLDDDFLLTHNLEISLKSMPSMIPNIKSMQAMTANPDSDALFASVLSGNGPDIVLGVPGINAGNYGARNAVVDLSQFDDFNAVSARFWPSSMMECRYNGGVYALPETQSFKMMFYRTDIFQKHNLKPPGTWQEFYSVVAELQKQNMQVGMPGEMDSLLMFMYQQHESLYKPGEREINLDSDKALAAFETMCELYSQYSLPIKYEFENRFKTGEMPLGIIDYLLYNQFSLFAPEIDGKWAMTVLPGTPETDESGEVTLNRSANTTITGSVIFKGKGDEAHHARCWDLLKWWTSEAVQVRFGNELEAVIGVGAKYQTANIAALSKLSWTKSEYDAIYGQLTQTVGTPYHPGHYIVERSVNFAFYDVYNTQSNAVEKIMGYMGDINKELLKKRREFG